MPASKYAPRSWTSSLVLGTLADDFEDHVRRALEFHESALFPLDQTDSVGRSRRPGEKQAVWVARNVSREVTEQHRRSGSAPTSPVSPGRRGRPRSPS